MKCHYFFIQVAHTIRQLLEQGNLITKSLNLKLKEVSDFILDSLTSITSDLNHLETNFQLRFSFFAWCKLLTFAKKKIYKFFVSLIFIDFLLHFYLLFFSVY